MSPRGQGFEQLTPQKHTPTRSLHQTYRIKGHGSSSRSAIHVIALLLAEQSWRIGEELGWSECLEVLLPMECSRDFLMSPASSGSKISPLTASEVTRATTLRHTSPPFIVVRLVRELMSVRVHAARFLPSAILISLTKIDSVLTSTVVHADLFLDKL